MGNVIIAGRKSPYSLYDEGLASFGDAGNYDHADAAGFIHLFSLPTRSEARQRAKDEANQVPALEEILKGSDTLVPTGGD